MAQKTLPKIKPPVHEPVTPKKNRVVKIDDETWDAAMAKAQADGIPLSVVVRHYMRSYAGLKTTS